jgi:hypothetical protein
MTTDIAMMIGVKSVDPVLSQNVWHNRAAAIDAPVENARPAAPRSCHCSTAVALRRHVVLV